MLCNPFSSTVFVFTDAYGFMLSFYYFHHTNILTKRFLSIKPACIFTLDTWTRSLNYKGFISNLSSRHGVCTLHLPTKPAMYDTCHIPTLWKCHSVHGIFCIGHIINIIRMFNPFNARKTWILVVIYYHCERKTRFDFIILSFSYF